MKTSTRIAVALSLCTAALAASLAHAQTKPSTQPTAKATLVEGTVTLPSTGPYSNIKCKQLKVMADSKEMVELKPIGTAPKWTREAQMTGGAPTYSYSVRW